MIRFLRFLFTGDGHAHEWEILSSAVLTQDGMRIGMRYFQQCSRCGKLKKVDLC